MQDKNVKTANKEKKQESVVLSPDALEASFANFFNIEKSTDDIILGFGQKVLTEKDTFGINHRVVMTLKGARVLNDLLSKAINE